MTLLWMQIVAVLRSTRVCGWFAQFTMRVEMALITTAITTPLLNLLGVRNATEVNHFRV